VSSRRASMDASNRSCRHCVRGENDSVCATWVRGTLETNDEERHFRKGNQVPRAARRLLSPKATYAVRAQPSNPRAAVNHEKRTCPGMCKCLVQPGGCREGGTIRRDIQCCLTFFSCATHSAPDDVAALGWAVWVWRTDRAGDAAARHCSLGVAARVRAMDEAAQLN